MRLPTIPVRAGPTPVLDFQSEFWVTRSSEELSKFEACRTDWIRLTTGEVTISTSTVLKQLLCRNISAMRGRYSPLRAGEKWLKFPGLKVQRRVEHQKSATGRGGGSSQGLSLPSALEIQHCWWSSNRQAACKEEAWARKVGSEGVAKSKG